MEKEVSELRVIAELDFLSGNLWPYCDFLSGKSLVTLKEIFGELCSSRRITRRCMRLSLGCTWAFWKTTQETGIQRNLLHSMSISRGKQWCWSIRTIWRTIWRRSRKWTTGRIRRRISRWLNRKFRRRRSSSTWSYTNVLKDFNALPTDDYIEDLVHGKDVLNARILRMTSILVWHPRKVSRNWTNELIWVGRAASDRNASG